MWRMERDSTREIAETTCISGRPQHFSAISLIYDPGFPPSLRSVGMTISTPSVISQFEKPVFDFQAALVTLRPDEEACCRFLAPSRRRSRPKASPPLEAIDSPTAALLPAALSGPGRKGARRDLAATGQATDRGCSGVLPGPHAGDADPAHLLHRLIVPIENCNDRIGISLSALLACIAVQFTVSFNLPQISYLTVLDWMFVVTYFCIALGVLISTVQATLLAAQPERSVQLNRIAGRNCRSCSWRSSHSA
jgi:hypothetical protein